MKPPPHVAEAVRLLNEALAADPAAVGALAAKRVPCNAALVGHSTVQTTSHKSSHTVSVLGLLNGVLGVVPEGRRAGWGWVTGVFEAGRIVRFEVTDTQEG